MFIKCTNVSNSALEWEGLEGSLRFFGLTPVREEKRNVPSSEGMGGIGLRYLRSIIYFDISLNPTLFYVTYLKVVIFTIINKFNLTTATIRIIKIIFTKSHIEINNINY